MASQKPSIASVGIIARPESRALSASATMRAWSRRWDACAESASSGSPPKPALTMSSSSWRECSRNSSRAAFRSARALEAFRASSISATDACSASICLWPTLAISALCFLAGAAPARATFARLSESTLPSTETATRPWAARSRGVGRTTPRLPFHAAWLRPSRTTAVPAARPSPSKGASLASTSRNAPSSRSRKAWVLVVTRLPAGSTTTKPEQPSCAGICGMSGPSTRQLPALLRNMDANCCATLRLSTHTHRKSAASPYRPCQSFI
mmetsp:Transcript_26439/g.79298  ORF Transcript_26439/g.79298 Transcript_26439/m.79298 type:complete len:268 (-) Transcript_26439:363-1166(-)